MGDRRYQAPYRRLAEANDRTALLRSMADDDVIMALAAASRDNNPLLANVLATEAMNRVRRSRTITTHLAEGTFAVDDMLQFTFVNPAMAQMLGGEWRDYVGVEMDALVRVRGVDGSVLTGTPACPLRRAIEDGTTREFDGEIERVAGRAVRASFIVAPIREDGHVLGAVAAFRPRREAHTPEIESKLRESELLQQHLVDAVEDYAIFRLSLDGTILSWNAGAENIKGWKPEEIIGKPFALLFREADVAAGLPEREMAIARSEGVYRDERAVRRRKDGTEFVASVNLTLIRNPRGEPAGFVKVTRDRSAAAALAVEQDLLVRALAQMHDAAIALGVDERVVLCNAAVERILGWRCEDLKGQPWSSLVPPGQADVFERVRARNLRGEAVVDEDVECLHRDGRRVALAVTASPVTEDGRVVGRMLTLRDVSERQRMTRELRAREAQYRRLVEHSPEPMAVHAEGKLLFINRAGARLLGVDEPRELVGRGVLDFVHADSRPTVVARLVAMLRDPTPLPPAEEKLLRIDGSVFIAETVALPIEYDGRPAVQLIIRDISHRKHAEEELERRVRERTAQLEQAMRDLRTFTDSASHDLRAPLRGIDAYAEDLEAALRAGRVDEATELAARISKENSKAQRLVRDLLDFARSTRKDIVPEEVDVTELVRELIEDLRRRHPERPANVTVQEGMRAVGDRALLSIALNNLISNATKYAARAADPRVEVFSTRDGDGTAFHVRDNGVGFPEHEMYRLFQPFARLSTASGFEGTGLGLAMVHRVITRHGGRIWAASKPGKGATFSFVLGDAEAR